MSSTDSFGFGEPTAIVCAWCGRVNSLGEWQSPVGSEARDPRATHGICPGCVGELPDLPDLPDNSGSGA